MKKMEIISYIGEKSIYSTIADNYTNISKQEIVDIVKELDYAVSQIVKDDEYKQIINATVDELEEIWDEELEEERLETLDYPMLKIGINTGTAFLNVFFVRGTKQDDLASLIDEYVQENKSDFAKWTLLELEEIYDKNEDIISENSTPINGGEFYIGNIALIEETSAQKVKKLKLNN